MERLRLLLFRGLLLFEPPLKPPTTRTDECHVAAITFIFSCIMAPLSTSNSLVCSTSLANLSSSRHRPPSLEVQREEGWTETWGGNDRRGSDDANGDGNGSRGGATKTMEMPYLPPRYITVVKDGCDYIGGRKTSGATEGFCAPERL